MNRSEIHKIFVQRFDTGDNACPSTECEIKEYESELGTLLPKAFIDFMMTFGPVYCSQMLGPIVDDELDLWDVNNISGIKESQEATLAYWSGGMPEEYVLFGNDSMGNAFCFKKSEENKDDSPVHFFDHDFCKMDKLADTFDEWLSDYIHKIPETPKADQGGVRQ
ncbi:MAG: SMI1/KNR4 family protein [Opitutaceae bacterium]